MSDSKKNDSANTESQKPDESGRELTADELESVAGGQNHSATLSFARFKVAYTGQDATGARTG